MSSTFVIIIEARPKNGFATYHIEYCKELIQETGKKYMFFQEMLKSNKRYSIAFLLQKLLNDGWNIVGQSQSDQSLLYTLMITYKSTETVSE